MQSDPSAGNDKDPEPAQMLSRFWALGDHRGAAILERPSPEEDSLSYCEALGAYGNHNLVLSSNPACPFHPKASKKLCFKEHGYVCEQESCGSIPKYSLSMVVSNLLRLVPSNRDGTSFSTTR